MISPSNGQFIFKEDKYLIEKSNQNNAKFDKLVFVRRDIKEFSIPQNIKINGSCSFEYSNIKEIYFSKSLIELKEGWCNIKLYMCNNYYFQINFCQKKKKNIFTRFVCMCLHHPNLNSLYK